MTVTVLKYVKNVGESAVHYIPEGGHSDNREASTCDVIVEESSDPNFGGKISLRIQEGPIAENGVNGTQVDTLIHLAKAMIAEFNKAYPASHNTKAIGHLELALAALQKRKEDREKRGVEGYNKA